MAYTESYTCDICGDKKGVGGQWFLAWFDCLASNASSSATLPLVQLTRWEPEHAHRPGAQHLCGARCVGTLMDRWMAEQHENPMAPCAK